MKIIVEKFAYTKKKHYLCTRKIGTYPYEANGVERSPVALLVWDQAAAGSNPVAPTKRDTSQCVSFLFLLLSGKLFFIYGFREAGPLYETHYKPVAQLCVDKDTRSSSPNGDLCYFMSSGCVSPASRNALLYTPAPQLRRKAACSGLRIEAGPLARTVRINSHHGRTCTA